ncbi:uncharacterized protein JCM10292_007054 [Rhodotorula paludigena]|uniref:uncharacterized protein n=1 Tax=Rhodotorula paludigena TaxID=86838 RepID=UPI00317BA203
MATDDLQAQPEGDLRALTARLARLVATSNSPSAKLSPSDKAARNLFEWLEKLLETDSPLSALELNNLAAFLRYALFAHTVSTIQFKDQQQKGTAKEDKVTTVLEISRVLLATLCRFVDDPDELNTRITEKGRHKLLIALLSGLRLHLDLNEKDIKKSTSNAYIYRELFASVLVETLVRVVIPEPDSLPVAAGEEIKDGRSTKMPTEAKYLALDVLNELLTRHFENKEVVRAAIGGDQLGALIQSGYDAHISQLAYTLAFRLHAPDAKRKSLSSASTAAREAWFQALFSETRFGSHSSQLRDVWRSFKTRTFDAQLEGFAGEIANRSIKRSQPFLAHSIKYDGQQLLETTIESQRETMPTPASAPSLRQIADGLYKAAKIWICRDIVASLVPQPHEMFALDQTECATARDVEIGKVREDEASKDFDDPSQVRLVAALGGVVKVHVDIVGQEQDVRLLQITFLLARSSPLTLDGRPHPAAPVHIDSARKSAVDKQGVDPSRRFHELEIQVAALDANITVLKKTLEARAQLHPRLGEELYRFPALTPQSAAPAGNTPTTSPLDAVHAPPGRSDSASAAQQHGVHPVKAVKFVSPVSTGPNSGVQRAPRKSSQAGPIVAEQPSSAMLATANPQRATAVAAKPGQSRISQVEKVKPPAAVVAHRPSAADKALESSQEASSRRAEELAKLANIEGRTSTHGGSSPAKSRSNGSAEDALHFDDVHAGREFGGGGGEDEPHDGQEHGVATRAPSDEKLPPPSQVVHEPRSSSHEPFGRSSRLIEVGSTAPGAAAESQHRAQKPPIASSTAHRASAADRRPVRTSSNVTDPPSEEDDINIGVQTNVDRETSKSHRAHMATLAETLSESPAARISPAKVDDTGTDASTALAQTIRKPAQSTGHVQKKVKLPAEGDEAAESTTSTVNKRPRRAAASKAAKLHSTSKGKKRTSRESSDAELDVDDEASGASAAYTDISKRVRRPAVPPARSSKRLKLSPSTSQSGEATCDSARETDFDSADLVHSLEDKRDTGNLSKRYGRERKSHDRANGKRRKVARQSDEPKKRVQPHRKLHVRSHRQDKSHKNDHEATVEDDGDSAASVSTARGRTVVKQVAHPPERHVAMPSVQSRTAESSPIPPNRPPPSTGPSETHDKRVTEDIPEPLDPSQRTLARLGPSKPRSRSPSHQPIVNSSFARLVGSTGLGRDRSDTRHPAIPLGDMSRQEQQVAPHVGAAHDQDYHEHGDFATDDDSTSLKLPVATLKHQTTDSQRPPPAAEPAKTDSFDARVIVPDAIQNGVDSGGGDPFKQLNADVDMAGPCGADDSGVHFGLGIDQAADEAEAVYAAGPGLGGSILAQLHAASDGPAEVRGATSTFTFSTVRPQTSQRIDAAPPPLRESAVRFGPSIALVHKAVQVNTDETAPFLVTTAQQAGPASKTSIDNIHGRREFTSQKAAKLAARASVPGVQGGSGASHALKARQPPAPRAQQRDATGYGEQRTEQLRPPHARSPGRSLVQSGAWDDVDEDLSSFMSDFGAAIVKQAHDRRNVRQTEQEEARHRLEKICVATASTSSMFDSLARLSADAALMWKESNRCIQENKGGNAA